MYKTRMPHINVVVVDTGPHSVRFFRIMRWWSSNLGHLPLRTQAPSLVVEYTYWTFPTIPSWHPMSRLPSRLCPSCICTGSSAHPGITCLRPIILIKFRNPPFPHPSPPDPDSSSPPLPSPRLSDSRCRWSHATAEISFSVVFSCRSAAV